MNYARWLGMWYWTKTRWLKELVTTRGQREMCEQRTAQWPGNLEERYWHQGHNFWGKQTLRWNSRVSRQSSDARKNVSLESHLWRSLSEGLSSSGLHSPMTEVERVDSDVVKDWLNIGPHTLSWLRKEHTERTSKQKVGRDQRTECLEEWNERMSFMNGMKWPWEMARLHS